LAATGNTATRAVADFATGLGGNAGTRESIESADAGWLRRGIVSLSHSPKSAGKRCGRVQFYFLLEVTIGRRLLPRR